VGIGQQSPSNSKRMGRFRHHNHRREIKSSLSQERGGSWRILAHPAAPPLFPCELGRGFKGICPHSHAEDTQQVHHLGCVGIPIALRVGTGVRLLRPFLLSSLSTGLVLSGRRASSTIRCMVNDKSIKPGAGFPLFSGPALKLLQSYELLSRVCMLPS
jgi:hypothetical protein